jgi:hypothetical protein
LNRNQLRGKYLEDLYEGNEWDRPLGKDEWRILYWILRFIAFRMDYLRGI